MKVIKVKYKLSVNSPVILSFVAICFVVNILNYITNGTSNALMFMTYRSSYTSFITYVRMFTHVLGHLDWNHFVGNMMYVLLLGPMLEEKYGSLRIIQVITIAAFVTGLINNLLFWNVALCGASGVCFAFILLSSFTSFKDGEVPLTFIIVAIIYLGQQVYDGIVLNDNVSNLAHIIGGVVGAIIGYKLNKK